MPLQKVLPATAALGFIAFFAGDVTPTGHFESPIGGQRTVSLPDGSTITLNTDSSIRIWGTEANLHVDMFRGEALFDMKPNPKRHLTVSAYDIELVDQGTIFDVRLVTDRTVRVTVQEGRVQLTANGRTRISLQANQQTTAADNLKTQSDAQNHVFKDQQESVLTRVKTGDELNGKWDKIIGGDG